MYDHEMELVPSYFSRLVVNAQQLEAGLIESQSFGAQSGRIIEIAAGLDAWLGDEDFWTTLLKEFPHARETLGSRKVTSQEFTQEVNLLKSYLGGDLQLATLIAMNVMGARATNPYGARARVQSTGREGRHLSQQAERTDEFESAHLIRRAWKFSRKVVRYAGGGLAIAADVLSPDPTGLTKAASIVGGVSAIIGGN